MAITRRTVYVDNQGNDHNCIAGAISSSELAVDNFVRTMMNKFLDENPIKVGAHITQTLLDERETVRQLLDFSSEHRQRVEEE